MEYTLINQQVTNEMWEELKMNELLVDERMTMLYCKKEQKDERPLERFADSVKIMLNGVYRMMQETDCDKEEMIYQEFAPELHGCIDYDDVFFEFAKSVDGAYYALPKEYHLKKDAEGLLKDDEFLRWVGLREDSHKKIEESEKVGQLIEFTMSVLERVQKMVQCVDQTDKETMRRKYELEICYQIITSPIFERFASHVSAVYLMR